MQGQFASVYALPMRLRAEVIGGLNLFGRQANAVREKDIRVAQALADTATIGIISERALREAHLLGEQLQTALNSRVIIEQAKGGYAERHGTDMATAWEALRQHCRNNNVTLRDVAIGYVSGQLEVDPFVDDVPRSTTLSTDAPDSATVSAGCAFDDGQAVIARDRSGVFQVRREIDLTNHDGVFATLHERIASIETDNVIIDTAGLGFIDAASVATIVSIAETLDGQRQLIVRHPNRQLVTIVEVCGWVDHPRLHLEQ